MDGFTIRRSIANRDLNIEQKRIIIMREDGIEMKHTGNPISRIDSKTSQSGTSTTEGGFDFGSFLIESDL